MKAPTVLESDLPSPPIVDKKQKSADVAIKFASDLADKGDPYGMFRMGQRYLRGDGVEKDMVKARLLLGKAAMAGSEEAKAELARLNGD